MKILLIICMALFLFGTISAYELICSDDKGDSGARLWNYNATEEEMNEIYMFLNSSNEDGLYTNCTLVNESISEHQKCEALFNPVINILNSNIDTKNNTINNQRYVVIILTCAFLIASWLALYYNGKLKGDRKK